MSHKLKKFAFLVTREPSKTNRKSFNGKNWKVWVRNKPLNDSFLYIFRKDCDCGCNVQYGPHPREAYSPHNWISKELRPAIMRRTAWQHRRKYYNG